MKKVLTLVTAVGLSTVVSYSQGLVSIYANTVQAYTNNLGVLGKASGTVPNGYYFDLLYSANLGISASATNLLNSANLSLWTDSGVSGTAGAGLSAGKITSGTSVAASGWTLPGATYDNERAYIIVGWSGGYGTTWASISNTIATTGLANGGWFGTTILAYNYAGGGASSLPAVNMWGNQTSTSGFGLTGGANQIVLNQISAVPEPSTFALAALGGASLLLFRRRQSK